MPYNMIFASDTDSTKMEYLKQRSRNGEIKLRKNSPFIVRTADATALERIEDGFIDTVVTDPPWGHYEKLQGDAEEFYASVLRELIRVVKSGGMIVMLLGDRQLTDDLSRKFSYVLAETARHEILVSGKKAVAVRWKRA
jgi:tRNA G10  N-methylase Trm11